MAKIFNGNKANLDSSFPFTAPSEAIPFGFPPAGAPFDMPPLVDVSNIKNKYLDLQYAGTSESQKLDIFLPENGSGPYPLVIHIHGGGFCFGDKRDGHIVKLLELLDRGYALATINYRLAPEAIFPAAVCDCKAAIRFLRANAEKYNIDSKHFGVIGGSAGGNLSAIVGLTGNGSWFDKDISEYADVSSTVQAFVDWFGPTDFSVMDEEARQNGFGMNDHNEAHSPESQYMGGELLSLNSDWINKANPMTYINEDMPPMLIQHGTKDRLVPFQQSEIFVKAIEEKLGKNRVEFIPIGGADHEDPLYESEENIKNLWNFFDKYLK